MVPSTFRIQGAYQFYPDFVPSWPGHPGPEPGGTHTVHIWYIMEAYLALYRATNEEKWLYLAGRQLSFMYGDNDWNQIRMSTTQGSNVYSLMDPGTETQLAGLAYYTYEPQFPILASLKMEKTAHRDLENLPDRGSIRYAGHIFDLHDQQLDFLPAPQQPTAKFTYSPPSPGVNQSVTFNASSSGPGWNGANFVSIVSYSWTFEGGNTTTTSDPAIIHKYTEIGIYNVTLNVTDAEGNWDTYTTTVNVKASSPTFPWWIVGIFAAAIVLVSIAAYLTKTRRKHIEKN